MPSRNWLCNSGCKGFPLQPNKVPCHGHTGLGPRALHHAGTNKCRHARGVGLSVPSPAVDHGGAYQGQHLRVGACTCLPGCAETSDHSGPGFSGSGNWLEFCALELLTPTWVGNWRLLSSVISFSLPLLSALTWEYWSDG